MGKNSDRALKELMPDTAAAFEALAATVFKDGALSLKTKELIAIGTAVSMGCGDCIDHHCELAKELGATPAEISEAMAVGFEMGIGRLYPVLGRAVSKNLCGVDETDEDCEACRSVQ